MKKICLIVVVTFLCISAAFAQTYEVPKDYILKAKEDYPKYESDVLKAIDFLEQTPWSEQPEKRDEAKAFVLKWIEGSPTVSIEINSEIVKFSKNNVELLGSYMYGYTKYALLNKVNFDVFQAKVAGVRAVITKYTNEPGHKKNSEVEKVIKLDKDGKLEDWIKTDFNKSS